jgi:hypothetical protein
MIDKMAYLDGSHHLSMNYRVLMLLLDPVTDSPSPFLQLLQKSTLAICKASLS